MKTIAILTAALLTSLTVAADAQVSTSVSFADINLASPAGKAVLSRRIARAADEVCGMRTGVMDLASQVAARRCRSQAIAAANQQVALRKTTAQYASAR